MRQQIRNRLEMTRGTVAAEVPPTRPGVRTFAAVVPQRDGTFLATRFDVLSDALVDEERYIGPAEILNRVSSFVATVDEAEAVLRRLGIDTETLDVPWNNDYPL